jgi:hypothetical protein
MTPKADRLQQFISLIVRAGCQDELDDKALCALALDLDEDAMFLFHQGYITITFSDRSRAVYDQVASHVGR